MLGIVGIVMIFAMVFGGYLLAGGKMTIILKSLPFEMMMIGGAAVGAFLIANDIGGVKHTGKDIVRVFKGPRWKPDDYRDLLCLLFELIRLAKANPVALEEHIETPAESAIFARYPRILADERGGGPDLRHAAFRLDELRRPAPGRRGAGKTHGGQLSPRAAFQPCASDRGRRLPALGIVAAVLGVIKTMSSIDQPPEILGKLIGGALVGHLPGCLSRLRARGSLRVEGEARWSKKTRISIS
jgi:chemotaxis protein MotA